MFRSNFLLAEVQDFLAGYQNVMNKDDYLKNYGTEERNNPSIIDNIKANIVSFFNKDGLGYCGGSGKKREKSHAALWERIKKCMFLLENWDMLSRYIVRKFGTLILKGIKGSNKTKINQSAKSNLSMEKLWSEADISRKWVSAWPSCYYCLINGKMIGESILSEMDKMISIITDHIKYIEAQQIRNTKAESDR